MHIKNLRKSHLGQRNYLVLHEEPWFFVELIGTMMDPECMHLQLSSLKAVVISQTVSK